MSKEGRNVINNHKHVYIYILPAFLKRLAGGIQNIIFVRKYRIKWFIYIILLIKQLFRRYVEFM